jgi:hypothetical protein
MAIIIRQPAAKILIPDACHIVKPAFLSAMVVCGNLGMSAQAEQKVFVSTLLIRIGSDSVILILLG